MATSVALSEAEQRAGTLVESLPYIRAHAGRTVVIKIGGAALDDPELARVVADDIALMTLVGMRVVVVHGGGPQISQAMEQAGMKPVFRGGLRVTDDAAMEIVRRVLIGSITSDLVARLGRAGLRAVGVWGADGDSFTASTVTGPDGEDIGRVGTIDRVDSALCGSLLDGGYTPVIASVAPDGAGRPTNINADVAAGAIAAALGAAKLVYLTNVSGLYSDLGDAGSLVSELGLARLKSLLPNLSDGMRPKASSAVDALEAGVGKIHILDGTVPHALLLEVFTDEGIGTQVLP